MKTYVIAGTYLEAKAWIAKNYQERVAIGDQQASTNDYVYVVHADELRGIQNPHGIFVGNWLGRPDILEIVQQLMMCSTAPNAALGKIYKQLTGKPSPVRPTPIVPGKSNLTYQQLINDLSEDLSKHIDNEVMASLAKKINGGILANTTKI